MNFDLTNCENEQIAFAAVAWELANRAGISQSPYAKEVSRTANLFLEIYLSFGRGEKITAEKVAEIIQSEA